MLLRRFAVLLLLALFPPQPAAAGQVDTVPIGNTGRRALRVGRVIEPGDEQAFHRLAETAPGALVILSGPGGAVAPALAIGREIRRRGLDTVVPANTDCASACSLIWLAGTRRLLGDGARIGLHATSFFQRDGTRVETHAIDGLLMGYLNDLGYAADATAVFTSTHAASIRWYDGIELRASGIPSDSFP